VAVATGMASGIGRATPLAFTLHGAKVVGSDIAVDGAQETVASVRASGGEATFVRADVPVAQDVAGLVQKVVDTYGRLDWAHNNAGIGGARFAPHECTEDLWDRRASPLSRMESTSRR
jgi:NAD(P)-dependent dehydrogenase (short-subunit alcohol dehydrogenase family)